MDPIDQFEEAIDLLIENRIVPMNLADRYPYEERTACLPFVIVANKDDDVTIDDNFQIFCELLEQAWLIVPVSARTGRGLDRLKQLTLEQLNVIRVYTRAPGREPDLTRPFVLKSGDTVETLAGKIHKDFIHNLKTVRIWGDSVYDGQLVQKEYILQDGDIVELRL